MKKFCSIKNMTVLGICGLLFFVAPIQGHAFIENIIRNTIVDGIAESQKEQIKSTPSQAYVALLQSFSVATDINIDVEMARKLWKTTRRPYLNTPHSMYLGYKKTSQACRLNEDEYQVLIFKDKDEVLVKEESLRNAFAKGATALAFVSDDTYRKQDSIASTSSTLRRIGYRTRDHGLFGDIADINSTGKYDRRCEVAVAILGMSEDGNLIVADIDGQFRLYPFDILDDAEFVMGFRYLPHQVDRSHLAIDEDTIGENNMEEKTETRESKISQESEDYIEKMRRELKK